MRDSARSARALAWVTGLLFLLAVESLALVPRPLLADVRRGDPTVPELDQPMLVPSPTTTTTTAARAAAPPATAPLRVVRDGPIAVPDDPYAPERVVRIGSIEIPKIGLVHALFEGVTLNNIDRGPSHWPGSAMPGDAGNTVIAGHRVTHSRPFRNIDKLVQGDEVIFTVAGRRSVYVVTGTRVVRPRDMWIVNQTEDATGTLFACHPPHSAAYRYVVHLALAARERTN